MAWPGDVPNTGRYGDWLLQLADGTPLESEADLPDWSDANLFDAYLVGDDLHLFVRGASVALS